MYGGEDVEIQTLDLYDMRTCISLHDEDLKLCLFYYKLDNCTLMPLI